MRGASQCRCDEASEVSKARMAFNNVDGYLLQLFQEKNNLQDNSVHAKRLLDQEITRMQHGEEYVTPVTLNNVHKGNHVHLCVKVVVPVKDHPNFNFVGKLLGPKGNSLKRLQESTQTKMAVLGRGSMRDKLKEEELRKSNEPKYSHLHEDLHVEIEAYATPAEAYYRISRALNVLQRFLIPDYYDEIRQQQLRELAILHGEEPDLVETTSSHRIDISPSIASPNVNHYSPAVLKHSLNNQITHKNASPVNSIGIVDEDSYDFDLSTERICEGSCRDHVRCLREMDRCGYYSLKLNSLYESNGYTDRAQSGPLVCGKLHRHFPRALRREHPYLSAYH